MEKPSAPPCDSLEDPEREPEEESAPSQLSMFRVFGLIAPLVVLMFMETFSFGLLSPMLSILQTEVLQKTMRLLLIH